MIRYNNISRPVHDPQRSLRLPHDSLLKIWGRDPHSPGLTALTGLKVSAVMDRQVCQFFPCIYAWHCVKHHEMIQPLLRYIYA